MQSCYLFKSHLSERKCRNARTLKPQNYKCLLYMRPGFQIHTAQTRLLYLHT